MTMISKPFMMMALWTDSGYLLHRINIQGACQLGRRLRTFSWNFFLMLWLEPSRVLP